MYGIFYRLDVEHEKHEKMSQNLTDYRTWWLIVYFYIYISWGRFWLWSLFLFHYLWVNFLLSNRVIRPVSVTVNWYSSFWVLLIWFINGCYALAVELASKDVQHELDGIQHRLNEFLEAEKNAVKERIQYDLMILTSLNCQSVNAVHTFDSTSRN